MKNVANSEASAVMFQISFFAQTTFPLNMKIKTYFSATALAIFCTFASAQSFGQIDAPASQARAPLPVLTGKVLDIQIVQIEVPAKESSRAIGGLIGAAVGAYAARDSSWQGQTLAGTLGAAVGAKAGEGASKETREALQIIVRLDDGRARAFVQEPNGAGLAVGDSVFIIGKDNVFRVMKDATKSETK